MREGGKPEDRFVTREEFAALTRRVWELEKRLGEAPPAEPAPAPAASPEPRPAPPATERAPPAAPPVTREPVSLETALGERWAPRVGALLVFLAALFFLGLGVERGWVTPPMQLALAALFGAGLLGAGAWLTAERGYGTYPQVLEGTGACVLYVTAFVAHAVPYYQRATGLTEAGGGVLMALVAAGTVALALHRDARVIAGLGYGLAFLTAGIGFDVLPGLTLPYVSLLGASLAYLVAARRWAAEALGGVLVTGGFLIGFAMRSVETGDPSVPAVLANASLPFAAFAWLTLRHLDHEEDFGAGVAALNLGWATVASVVLLGPGWDPVPVGRALLAWCAVATGLTVAAGQRGVGRRVVSAYGTTAVLLFLLWPPALFAEASNAALAITLTYAAGALALATLHATLDARGAWKAGVVLGTAAAAHAILLEGRPFPGGGGGGWEAWVTLLLVAPAFGLLVGMRPDGSEGSALHQAAFGVGVAFLAAWAFALFGSPFLVTLFLVAGGVVLVAAALSLGGAALVAEALLAGIALVAFAGVKAATWDAHAADLPAGLAALEAAVVAGALLALHHVGLERSAATPARAREAGALLVGGSAVVVASFLVGYAQGAWVSVGIAVLGVLYLGTGFGLTEQPVYRWTGFGVLGFVVLRVFVVDLENADLAVRALVFLALGGILLGVGYAYARARRAPEPALPPEPFEPPGPGPK